MYLHEDAKAFTELINVSANHVGLQPFQVEKDYYTSMFLGVLNQQPGCEIVFKGGTSLSKCHRIIHRFSEDMDIALMFTSERAGDGMRKRLKQNILKTAELLGMDVTNRSLTQSDRDFNQYDISYEKLFHGDDAMRPQLLIETIVAYRPYPCEKLDVHNFVTDMLTELGRHELIIKYDLAPFPMTVQSIERTFVDKLFAICDYHLDRKYARYSRHLYDLHMIWTSARMNLMTVKAIMPQVVRDRQLHGINNRSCEPGINPQAIFSEIIATDVFKRDYIDVTSTFIYRPIAYAECIRSMEAILGMEILPREIDDFRR